MPLYVTNQINNRSPAYTEIGSFEDVKDVIHSDASPFLSDNTDPLYLFLLTGSGLYFSDDALQSAPELVQAISGYTFLRPVRGVSGGGGIAAFGTTQGETTSQFLGDENEFVNGFDDWHKNSWGVNVTFGTLGAFMYTGFSGEWATGIYHVNPYSVTRFKFTRNLETWYTQSGQLFYVYGADSEADAIASVLEDMHLMTPDADGWYTSNYAYIVLLWLSNDPPTPMNDPDTHPFWETFDYAESGNVQIAFSDDFGDTITETEVAAYVGDSGYDCDDFNLGVHVVTANHGIWYTDGDYEGSFVELSGLTGLDGSTSITTLRVPYRKANGSFNNNPNSLQFIYGTAASVSGSTLWRVDFDTTDGTIISEVDITPSISGTTYAVKTATTSENALEINGIYPQRILAIAQPDGGGTIRAIVTTNGGSSWSTVSSDLDMREIRWLVGSTTRALFTGQDGIQDTPNTGSTLRDKLGDFPDTPVGGYILPRA